MRRVESSPVGSHGSNDGSVQSRPVDASGVGKGDVAGVGELVDDTSLVVPRVVAVRPGQHLPHGHEQVVKGPRDDDVVVHAHDAGDDHHAVANT